MIIRRDSPEGLPLLFLHAKKFLDKITFHHGDSLDRYIDFIVKCKLNHYKA